MLPTTLLILLWPACVALGAIWGVAIVRQVRASRQVPSLRAGVAMADAQASATRVTAIVPAHNEEASIGPVIASLRAQRGVDLAVIIALDRCTDGTRAAAEHAIDGDPRFSIIDIGPCPPGWPGKVNALWQAARAAPATGESGLLLFLDADVTLDPDCIRAAVALRARRGLGMLTLLSTLRHRHWFERLVQPACVMELAYEFPLARSNAPVGAGGRATGAVSRPFVNGQFVLIDRASYDRLGGHAALAGDIMEDFALARLAADAGVPLGALPADGMLVAGMYDSWDAFVRGWTRIYLAASGRKVRRLRKWAVRLWVACALLPVLVLGAGVLAALATESPVWLRAACGASAGLALALWAGFLAWAHARQRAPWWSTLAHPVTIAWAGLIQWRAARTLASRRPIEWAGKAYVFEPR